jgi:transposase|tara:strand:+ start:176 stop:796 length:621 start_codon:yes stop_codon:yes gene_type:complete
MEDVLEAYQRPLDADRPLVCLDEASTQLLAETRKAIAVEPGKPKRVDAEYRRCGTASVFMVNAPLEGKRHVRVRQRRTRKDFAEIIRELCDDLYPHAERIVLVMDNLNTHGIASLYEAFEPSEARRLAEKLEIHYTPKHGSWLNMAEIELSILSRQCMKDYFESREELATVIGHWERSRNEKKTGIDWRFTTADARIKLRKLYPTM